MILPSRRVPTFRHEKRRRYNSDSDWAHDRPAGRTAENALENHV